VYNKNRKDKKNEKEIPVFNTFEGIFFEFVYLCKPNSSKEIKLLKSLKI
jgi:hypothetical protein